MRELREIDENVHILDFSRNFGKESAILAGLREAKRISEELEIEGGAILIDADLQDPIELIHKMYEEYFFKHYDVIRVKRINRLGEGALRSLCGNFFYKIFNILGGFEIQNGARDFGFFSFNALDAVLQLCEYHRFSKAIFEWIGFERKWLEYEYIPRNEGKSGWSFWSLFKYAIEGFISFSTAPLRLAFILGFFASFISLGYGGYVLIDTLVYGNTVKGYPSLICVITFFGGITLIVLGIIGEYIARIYEQVKNRPHYFIKNNTKDKNEINK